MKKTKKELYDAWVERVCRFIEEVGPGLGLTSCAMQSKPVLDKQPEVVFLGYNAHEVDGYMGANRERFYEGNPYFHADTQDPKWKVWYRTRDMFSYPPVNWAEPVTEGNFVFMNVVYFGSNTIKELQAKEGSKEVIGQCLDFTAEVVQEIFQPKCVVCFSVNECFNLLAKRFSFTDVDYIRLTNTEGKPVKQRVVKGMWGKMPVYGIPHPSGRVSYADWGGIGLWLKGEMIAPLV